MKNPLKWSRDQVSHFAYNKPYEHNKIAEIFFIDFQVLRLIDFKALAGKFVLGLEPTVLKLEVSYFGISPPFMS